MPCVFNGSVFLLFFVYFILQEKNYGLHWPTISIICYFIVYVFGLFIAAGFGKISLLDSILSLALVELTVQPMMYLPQVSIDTGTPINVYAWFCLSTAKSKFPLLSPVAD